MKKAILSLLVVLSLSAAVTTPSQAEWSIGPYGTEWCNPGGACFDPFDLRQIKPNSKYKKRLFYRGVFF